MRQSYIQKNRIIHASDVRAIQTFGVSQRVAEYASSIGVTEKTAKDFFEKNTFHAISEMVNLQEAASLVKEIGAKGGHILIYGDYDADGLSASAALSLFFSSLCLDHEIVIPTREDGYGMHRELLEKAFAKRHVDLVLTVDCGISNRQEVEFCKENGVPVIVTDHHELPAELPDCLCVNPKMGYPFGLLSGSAVVFKLIEAMSNRETALRYADLISVGIVGDVMPLRDENRAILQYALDHFTHVGLKKLLNLKSGVLPTTDDYALRICPKINAAGRMGDPQPALALLLHAQQCDGRIVSGLVECNAQRQKLSEQMLTEAKKKIDGKDRVAIAIDDTWKIGLCGICANALCREFGIPAFVLTRRNGVYVGSGRGLSDIDLFEVVSSCKDLLLHFGGHKASVGFSVAEDRLTEFCLRLKDRFADRVPTPSENVYDMVYDAAMTEEGFFDDLKKLQPLLPSEVPTFYTRSSVASVSAFGADRNHLKLVFENGLTLKGFYRFAKYLPYLKLKPVVECLFQMEYDLFEKRYVGILRSVSLLNGIRYEDIYALHLLDRNFSEHAYLTHEQFCERMAQNHAKYLIFATYLEFERFTEQSGMSLDDFYCDFFELQHVGQNTVLISPEIVPQDGTETIAMSVYRQWTPDYGENTLYYPPQEDLPECVTALQPTREDCLATYFALKDCKHRHATKEGVWQECMLFLQSRAKFELCCRILEDLQLLENWENPFEYQVSGGKRTDLGQSRFYRLFHR